MIARSLKVTVSS